MGDFPEPYKRNMLLLFSCDQEHLFEVRRLFPEFEDFGSAAGLFNSVGHALYATHM